MKTKQPHTNLIMRHLMMFLTTCLLVALQACQFDSDADNFVELQKPDDELMILIDVAQLNPDEIIYARTNSQFFFSSTAAGKELLQVQFFLDGNPLHYDPHFEVAYLEQREADNKIHDLTVLVAFSTGTGSLAEHAGLEAYVGQHNFKLKFIDDNAKLNLRKSINQDGQLVLEWDQPTQYDIMYYKVYDKQPGPTGGQVAHIANPQQTEVTIPSYAYGSKQYSVAAYINNSYALFIEEEIAVTSEPITQQHVSTQRTAADKMHITWDNPNPYPTQYLVELADGTIHHIADGQQGITIPVGLFPSTHNEVTLHVLPQSIDPADFNTANNYNKVTFYLGDPRFFSTVHAFDPKNNRLHHFNNNKTDSYELPKIKYVSTKDHNLSFTSDAIASINQSGLVALKTYDQGDSRVKVYKDYTLSTPPILNIPAYTNYIQLTNNNLLVIEKTYETGVDIYNTDTGNRIISKTWTSPHTDGYFSIDSHMSLDGSTLLVRCMDTSPQAEHYQWVEHYKIENNSLQLVDTKPTADLLSLTTHPHSGDIISQYITGNQLTQEIIISNPLNNILHTIEGRLLGVDPITGNVAYFTYNSNNPNIGEIVVLQANYELLRLPTSTTPHSSNFFNHIIEFNNSYINIEPLL